MKNLTLLFTIFLGFLLSGCATTFTEMNPDYKGKSFPDKTLNVLPLTSKQITLSVRDHFIDDFKTPCASDCEDILSDTANYLLNTILAEKVNAKNITVGKLITTKQDFAKTEKTLFEKSKKPTFGDEIYVYVDVPKKAAIEAAGITSDFLIIFSDFQFGTSTTTHHHAPPPTSGGGNGGHMGGSTSTNKTFDFTVNYVIWDYSQNQAVAWGKTSSSASANWYIARADWVKNFNGIITNILMKSPFKSSTGRR